jgi:hypothetical protein
MQQTMHYSSRHNSRAYDIATSFRSACSSKSTVFAGHGRESLLPGGGFVASSHLNIRCQLLEADEHRYFVLWIGKERVNLILRSVRFTLRKTIVRRNKVRLGPQSFDFNSFEWHSRHGHIHTYIHTDISVLAYIHYSTAIAFAWPGTIHLFASVPSPIEAP